jgi:OFA family oxalate/formate antiporter-like MFS transporter
MNGIACLFGAVCTLLVRRPDHAESIRPVSVHGFVHQMRLDHLDDAVEHALHPERFRRVEERKDDDGQSVA